MRYFSAILGAFALLVVCGGALAEKRVALVIGNSAYENTATLKNPKNDAADMAALLKKLGFEVVEGFDLDKRKMERVVREFGIKLAGTDLAFFFYAGHGLQVAGKNYMVPIDAKLALEGDVDFEVLELALVLKQMEREAKTRVVLLDACRDNPLTRSLRSSTGSGRSAQLGQGLAKMEQTPVGTLIGYSTEPGSVALDGEGRNSPYTQALLQHLDVAGRDLNGVLNAVRGDVVKVTGGKQTPWEHTSLLGSVYLKQEAPKAEVKPAEKVAGLDSSVEVAFWNSVQGTSAVVELQTYLDRYPTGAYADLARIRIEALRAAEATKKAEQARLAEDARKADGKREAEAKAAEARKAEQARKADEATRLANLQTAAPKTLPTTEPIDMVELARKLQTELKRVGCDPGSVDGKWGDTAKKALAEFVRLTKASVPGSDPTEDALRAVTDQKGRICPLKCEATENEVNGKCVAKAKSVPATRTADRPKPEGPKEAWKPPQFCKGGNGSSMCPP
jgi:uncharacterized caspase-like protein